MKFFYAETRDTIDPSYNFDLETSKEWRMPHSDDVYAHETFSTAPYHGILFSWSNIGKFSDNTRRYSLSQRQRLLRVGLRKFFRIENPDIETMGDCGAFAYHQMPEPPVSVDEIFQFYIDSGVDYGISVDHVILGYDIKLDNAFASFEMTSQDWISRQEITLDLAQEFLSRWSSEKPRFKPLGVAQGWSPKSYQRSVEKLQNIGYERIALGGMVPLKTPQILTCLETINEVRKPDTQIHLLGVHRVAQTRTFGNLGVTSFDSSSPMRQAFLDDYDNYYTMTDQYTAIRIPQSDANPRLSKMISSGELNQAKVMASEKECMQALKLYDQRQMSVEGFLETLSRYDEMHKLGKRPYSRYKKTLEDRPWESCGCSVCKAIGIHISIFRGAERNKRRGFHNIWTTKQRLDRFSPDSSSSI